MGATGFAGQLIIPFLGTIFGGLSLAIPLGAVYVHRREREKSRQARLNASADVALGVEADPNLGRPEIPGLSRRMTTAETRYRELEDRTKSVLTRLEVGLRRLDDVPEIKNLAREALAETRRVARGQAVLSEAVTSHGQLDDLRFREMESILGIPSRVPPRPPVDLEGELDSDLSNLDVPDTHHHGEGAT